MTGESLTMMRGLVSLRFNVRLHLDILKCPLFSRRPQRPGRSESSNSSTGAAWKARHSESGAASHAHLPECQLRAHSAGDEAHCGETGARMQVEKG